MSLPDCFGKWMSKPSNKCEQCSNQVACYNKMREKEKQLEKLKVAEDLPWYKRKKDDDVDFAGVCDKCS